MYRIIVTGYAGQLGSELCKIIETLESELGHVSKFYRKCEIVKVDIMDLNISKLDDVRAFLHKLKPYAVVNCAAMTNVDECETKVDIALSSNAIGPRNLAIACDENNSKLVHISTDYVFDGNVSHALSEYDRTNPKSIYGKTKYLGEKYVKLLCSKWFIIRTAWLYGYSGHNFVKTIINSIKKKQQLKIVDDQIGNPTSVADVAWHICKLIPTYQFGLYHCTCNGECSWFDFAKEIAKVFNISAEILPCSTDQFPRPAKRPSYSSLDNLMLRNTVGDDCRYWKEALRDYATNLKK